MTAGGPREALESMGATRLRLEIPDSNGILRGKYLPAEKLLNGKGAGFSDVLYCLTSADEVFENPQLTSYDTGWPDVMAVPDWTRSTGPVGAGRRGGALRRDDEGRRPGRRGPAHALRSAVNG